MAYDSTRAAVFNRLIQLGYSEQEALNQAGISDADFGDYSLGPNGIIGPLVDGSGDANNLAVQPVFRSTYDQTAGRGDQQFVPEQTPGISPYGEADDPLEPPPVRAPRATTFDEFGTEIPAGPDAFAFDEASLTPAPTPVDPFAFDELTLAQPDAFAFDEATLVNQPVPVDAFSFDEASLAGPDPFAFDEASLVTQPTPVDPFAFDEASLAPPPVDAFSFDEAQFEAQQAADTKAKLKQAQQQAAVQQRQNETNNGDWRVRIRLMPGANYLYKATPDKQGILKPLAASDGVIFPYVPQIQTNYQAKYDPYDLVHSNYRGYFYRGSSVNEVQITGTFTAQDTKEAEYVLAVIHFFRSVTKMFYGKDALRGAPPPLVELSGFGAYQFNNHPCVVSNFNYNLPNNVNYVRVTPNNQGLNLTPRRNLAGTPSSNTLDSITNRLRNAGLPRGATPERQSLGEVVGTVSGVGQTTYVPTKIELQITLLPIQTRQQVSQQFSLENFANGNLIKGGFW